MLTINKECTVTILVPFHGSGNVIKQREVSFKIFADTNIFKAVPQLSEGERRLASLPEEMQFWYKNDEVCSAKGNRDGNQHVLNDIVQELKKQHFL